jgi:Mg-chelatase subunit ChlI
MDPLDALGLATDVVQFIDLGIRLLQYDFRIHRAATVNHVDLLRQILDFIVKQAQSTGLPATDDFVRLAITAAELARRLHTRIDDVSEKWKSNRLWRAALNSTVQQQQGKEIQELLSALRSLRIEVLEAM